MQYTGIRFEPLPTHIQARLDRFVFGQMRQHARLHRHVPGMPPAAGELERRKAFRVPLRANLAVMISLPFHSTAPRVGELVDVSVSGCSLRFVEPFAPGSQLWRLRLDHSVFLEIDGTAVRIR